MKITGGQKSHFFKINKGSRFGLLRFGSVLKSRKRFGRFEVRFNRGSGGSRFGIFRFDPTLKKTTMALLQKLLFLSEKLWRRDSSMMQKTLPTYIVKMG